MSGGARPGTWEGRSFPELAPHERLEVFAMATDYRGDVSLTLVTGEVLTGFVFANETRAEPPHLRLFPADRDERVIVAHAEIRAVAFSGADKAFGRSWDAWVLRWERARLAIEQGLDPGEFEPEPDPLA